MRDLTISDTDLRRLFGLAEPYRHWGLAVSGGADSTALMQLAARLPGGGHGGRHVTVLTVDHGLREESAEEARFVARAAAALGLPHKILHWTAEKPSGGLQAAARSARYDLMAQYALEVGIDCLLTAHHLDDQAETFLMRLRRGSGIDGLAGIPAEGSWAGLPVLRPFLDVSGERLRGLLREAGVAWVDDPSNEDARFERVAVREAMKSLESLGFTAHNLALTARRIARARQALDAAAEPFLRDAVHMSPAGYCMINRGRFASAPEEIALRVMGRVLQTVRGGQSDLRLAKLETLVSALRSGEARQRTLGGCRIDVRHDDIAVLREPGRAGLGETVLKPGQKSLWDRRFRVAAPDAAGTPVTVRALGAPGVRQVNARSCTPLGVPADAASTVVSFWRGEDLLAVPTLGFHADPAAIRYEARFVNTMIVDGAPRH